MRNSLVSGLALASLAVVCATCFTGHAVHAQTAQASLAVKSPGGRDVIVILKDQMIELAPQHAMRYTRGSTLASAQASVIEPLQRLRERPVHSFRTLNGFATNATTDEITTLQQNPQVLAVVPDRVIRLRRMKTGIAAGSGSATSSSTSSQASAASLCDTLEPEALQTTNAAFDSQSTPQAQRVLDAQGQPVTGKGVKVAFLADGLDITVPGFTRPDGSKVFVDYKDFSGDPAGTPTSGAEAFGDASSIAAQDMPHGKPLVYDVSGFGHSSKPGPSPCNVRIRGIAPGASLVGLKVFSAEGLTTTSTFVQAIDYAVTDAGVDVLNESFGSNPSFDSNLDPVSLANSAAVRAGVTVVVSTGDGGTAGTLGSPATSTDVIAVGATTTFRLYAQIGFGFDPLAHGFVSNNISSISSSGFSQKRARTVDVVAPGDLGWALCSPDAAHYADCGSNTQAFGGTSQATPLTAGEAALIIQAYRSTHGGADPIPSLVKRYIMSTATDLGAPAREQGAGLINALAAVNTALYSVDKAGKPQSRGDGLLFDFNTAEFTAAPGAARSISVYVRNTGATARHLTPHFQALGAPLAGSTSTVNMAPSSFPTFLNVNGSSQSYTKKTFTVPANAEHLDASISIPGGDSVVYLGLLNPSGQQAAYSLPQGAGNGFAHVDIVHPAPGTWTALIATPTSSGYSGPLQFTWAAEKYVTSGSVSPAVLTLQPGESRTFTANFSMPSTSGDASAAVRFDASAEGRSINEPSFPITLRTLIPVGSSGGDFTGTLTGGNGRGGVGPTQSFEFDVPNGAANVSLSLKTTDAGYPLIGFLVDPHGMALSTAVNADPYTGAPLKSMHFFHEHPEAGRYYFVLTQNYYSGGRSSLPFVGHVGLDTLPVSAPKMPISTSVQVSASGPGLSIPVTVTNTSSVNQLLFADARLLEQQQVTLPTYLCSDSADLPGACLYTFVPPEVNNIQILAQSTAPITLSAANSIGTGDIGTMSPEIYGRNITADSTVASLTVHEVPWSAWVISPALVGPFESAGAPTKPLSVSTGVSMRPFDSAASSSAGNLWSDAVLNADTFNPLVLAPGQSGVITLKFKPGTSLIGKTIKGIVFIDNFNYVLQTGDEIARVPYTYKVVK